MRNLIKIVVRVLIFISIVVKTKLENLTIVTYNNKSNTLQNLLIWYCFDFFFELSKRIKEHENIVLFRFVYYFTWELGKNVSIFNEFTTFSYIKQKWCSFGVKSMHRKNVDSVTKTCCWINEIPNRSFDSEITPKKNHLHSMWYVHLNGARKKSANRTTRHYILKRQLKRASGRASTNKNKYIEGDVLHKMRHRQYEITCD